MSAPYVAVILMAVIVGWMMAARSLGRQFASIVGDQGREEIGEVQHAAPLSTDKRAPDEAKSILTPVKAS